MPHNSWQKPVFDISSRDLIIEELVKEIEKDNVVFQYGIIAVSGISGVSIGSILSYLTKIPLAVVRKESDIRTSEYDLEYTNLNLKTWNYCFIDDLIDTGKTLKRVIEGLEKETEKFELKKVYLYSSGYNSKEGYIDNEMIGIKNVPYFSCFS